MNVATSVVRLAETIILVPVVVAGGIVSSRRRAVIAAVVAAPVSSVIGVGIGVTRAEEAGREDEADNERDEVARENGAKGEMKD
jgi:hypothetical protein